MKQLAHVCVLVLFVLRDVLFSLAFDAHCFGRCGRPRSFLRLVPASNDWKPLEDLLQKAGIDSKKCDIESLSGGFCNSLHKVTCGDEQVRERRSATVITSEKNSQFIGCNLCLIPDGSEGVF